MTAQPTPLQTGCTYEQIMEFFRQSKEEFQRSKEEHERSKEEYERSKEEFQRTREKSEADYQKSKEEYQRLRERDEADYQKSKEEFQRTRERSEAESRAIWAQMKETDKKIAALGDRIGELIETMVEGGIVRKFRELGYQFTQCARWVEFENTALEISGEIDLFLENGEYALLTEVKTNLSVSDVKEHLQRLEKYRRYADAKNDKRKFLAAAGGGVVRKNVREFAAKNGIYVLLQSGEAIEILSPPKGVKPRVW